MSTEESMPTMKAISFDFTGGVKVKPSEVNRWHTEAFEYIRSGKGKEW